MFKVYLNNKLQKTFKNEDDAALLATNLTISLTLEDKVEVWGPKTNYVHFNIGYNIDGDDYKGIN